MSKLRAVVRHEFMTVVKQPSFWAMLVVTPLLIGIIIAISALGNRSSEARVEELQSKLKNVVIVDDSGFILPDIVQSSGQRLEPSSQLDELKEDVRTGELTGLVYFPSDLRESRKYQVYVESTDIATLTTMTGYAGNLLNLSIFAPIGSPEVIALAQGQAEAVITTYDNGVASPGFNKYIVPGLIAVLFFLILIFAIGYALTSISEEKENRSMEMLLTHVHPRIAIIGKLLAVILITLAQLAFFAVVGLLAYAVALALGVDSIRLPAGINLVELVFDPVTIAFGLGFLLAGFALYSGLMAILASFLPAKQANAWSGFFYMAAFSPFWFISAIITNPNSPAVVFATFFPPTAPSTTLIRNTLGSISGGEAVLALASMTLFALLSIWFAIRIFPRGALEFENTLSLRAMFGKK